jgi:RNA polymerase sigma-70 factor (ECF subfamily)
METSPADLWTAWQHRRDEAAFETLVRPEIPTLCDAARRWGLQQADAEDVVQDVLTALAREHSARPGEVGVGAWLMRATRFRALNLRRGASRRTKHEGHVAAHAIEGERGARLEVREEVERALTGMADDDREVLLLRFVYDLEYRELAYVLGVSENVCRVRVHRASGRLREHLGPRGLTLLTALPLLDLPNAGDWIATATHAGSSLGWASIGGFAMGTAAKMAAAAVAGGLIVWLTGLRADPIDAREDGRRVEASTPAPALRGADGGRRPVLAPPSPSEVGGEVADHAVAEGPTERELLDLARSVGPRRIEGVVLLGREPATQGTARVWRRSLADRLFHDRTIEGAVAVPIGRDGTFAFNDLEPGEYTFDVDVPGYAPRFVGQAVTDQESRRRVLVLGSGRIEGHVFDQDGRPLGDIVVQVSQGGDGTYLGRGSTAEVRSKADGTYSVDGLVSGPYWVIAYVRQDRTARDAALGLKCDVVAGKTAVLDFGTPTPSPAWSGKVLRTDGTPVLGPGAFAISSVERTAYSRFLAYDARGEFSHRIPPGTYRVTEVRPVGHPPIKPIAPSEIVVGREDVSQDVRFPGSRITGVIYDGHSALLSPRGTQSVGWRPENEGPYSQLGVFAEPDGSFVIEGLLPGRYVLSGHPRDLVDSSGRRMTVQVSEKSDLDIKLWTAPP